MKPTILTPRPNEQVRGAEPFELDALRHRATDVDVWCASLDGYPAEGLREMEARLSSDELARARGFYFDRDRRRYIAARAILRSLLGRYLDRAPENLTFDYGSHGKPALAVKSASHGGQDGQREIDFNLAHSEGLALYAFTCSGEVGVDLEYMRDVPDWRQVAESFFSRRELARLHARPREIQRKEFFRGWTRQEAVLKAMGAGIGGAIEDRVESRYRVYPLHAAPGFAGALAVAPTAEWMTLQRWQEPWNEMQAERSSQRRRLMDLSTEDPNFL